jgi:DNA-binding transcriptional LysR family regulator
VDLNLRLLRYFVAVADEGHFGRAAAALFITPPALTQQIRRLEQEVGFTLLDRARHPVVPTPSGAAFLREARAVLEAARRAEAVARSEARQAGGRFDLGFVVTPLGRLTRALVDGFAAGAGEGVLRLVELTLADQTGAVLDGRVDAGLAWGPVVEPRLRCERALTAPRVAVLAAGHPLAGRERIAIAELNDDVHVQLAHEMVGEAWSRWWSVDPRPDGSTVRYGPVNHTLAELLEQVAGGQGVAISSALLGEAHSRPDVVLVPLVDVEPSDLVLCTRPEDHSPRLTLLRRLVHDLSQQER